MLFTNPPTFASNCKHKSKMYAVLQQNTRISTNSNPDDPKAKVYRQTKPQMLSKMPEQTIMHALAGDTKVL